MNIFKSFEAELSYKDILQLDGCFSAAHINYGKSPVFNGVDGKTIATQSRKNKVSSIDKVDDVIGLIHSFNGTEQHFKKKDRITMWKYYWLEYINAFDKIMESLPNSIVTVFIGRQAIELGIKYLLLKKTGNIVKQHDLKELSELLFDEYHIQDEYMKDVKPFCELYCQFIEGENVEYLRYPEYKDNRYFAGNRLDVPWLSYNYTLVLLKLIHLADLESEV